MSDPPLESRPLPKSRPPKSLRDKILKALPGYSGFYSVGVLDIEVPVDEPRTFSHITRSKRHVLELETVLFSIYYPSALGSGSGPDPSGKGRWNRGNWLQRPRMETSTGYARFAGLPKWPMMTFFLFTTWFTMIPAHRNAKLATHWPPDSTPTKEKEHPTFPLLIFSHGLGGNRSAYSSVCGEFASHGFVVIAMEHRDGSGPRTLVNHTKDGKGSRAANAGKVDHLEKEYKRSYDRVDYIFPQGNPKDTSPYNEQGVDEELRIAQIEFRKAEVKELERILDKIWAGDGEEIAEQNLRKLGYAGSSSRGLQGIDWRAWKGRFHRDNITMLGHSFGAATSVEILRDREQFPSFSQGIIYDIWGAPLKEGKIDCPILAINSEAFMYWEENFKVVTSIVEEARSTGAPCWMLTVQGTIHISQSDFQILYPSTCRHVLKATVNPQRAISLNINASLEFLRQVLPQLLMAGSEEGILNLQPVDSLPNVRLPPEKWIGMSLRAPHNLLRRPPRRKKVERMIEKEVWMHISPKTA